MAPALGAIVGFAVLSLGGLETRWVVAITLVTVGGLLGMTFVRSLESLQTLLVFTLQFEIALRPMYGRASTGGLQIYGSGLLACAILGVLYMRGEPWHWRGHLYRPIRLMLVMMTLSFLTSSEHMAGVDFILFQGQLVLIYVAVLTTIRTEADIRKVVVLLLATLVTQSIVYFIQSALGITFNMTGDVFELSEELPRPGGTVSANPAGFASYMIPLLFIAIVQFMTRSSWRRPWTLIATVLGLVALVLTFTRAAWAGFFLGFSYILAFGARYTRIRPRTVVMIVVAALVVVVALAPLIQRRLSESVGDAYDERAGLMRIAMVIIKAHPVLGVGPGAYSHVFKEYVPSGMRQWLYTVHNEYLLRAAETGVLGGVAFVWLMLATLRQSRDLLRFSSRPEIRALALAWGAALFNLAWQMYWVPWRGFGYNALFWLMLALIEVAARLEFGESACAPKRRASSA